MLQILRLQILYDLLDAVSGNTTDTETHTHDHTAHVEGEGLSDVTTVSTETDEGTSSWRTKLKVFV